MPPKQLNPDLSDSQKDILFDKGTEAPFTGQFLNNKENGMYVCANCGAELFSSSTKFDSGSGWPSFYDVAKSGAVKLVPDASHGMERTEAVCTNCGGHLGHVFDESISPTGKHFCINGCALTFKPQPKNN